MGISVISSYRGGLNFEAIGLSRALVDEFFPGLTSRISGIGLAGIAIEAADQHARAYDETLSALPVGGLYRYRASRRAPRAGGATRSTNCSAPATPATTRPIANIPKSCASGG